MEKSVNYISVDFGDISDKTHFIIDGEYWEEANYHPGNFLIAEDQWDQQWKKAEELLAEKVESGEWGNGAKLYKYSEEYNSKDFESQEEWDALLLPTS